LGLYSFIQKREEANAPLQLIGLLFFLIKKEEARTASPW